MDSDATAQALTVAIDQVPRHFMLDPATRERGGGLGFPGILFTVVGRAGVLGRVPADIAAAALVFFNPDTVSAAWYPGTAHMDPRDAAAIFAACGHTWARGLPDSVDYDRIAHLAAVVITAAPIAAAPLFAGWRILPEPAEPKALAVHRFAVLRELWAALLGSAVASAGLDPRDAVRARDPELLGEYGWPAESTGSNGDRSKPPDWDAIQTHVRQGLITSLAPLPAEERTEFAALATDFLQACPAVDAAR